MIGEKERLGTYALRVVGAVEFSPVTYSQSEFNVIVAHVAAIGVPSKVVDTAVKHRVEVNGRLSTRRPVTIAHP